VAAIALPLAASVAIVWGPGIFHSNPQIDLVLLSQNAAFEVFENHIMKEIPVGT